jgi:hypothetical protein
MERVLLTRWMKGYAASAAELLAEMRRKYSFLVETTPEPELDAEAILERLFPNMQAILASGGLWPCPCNLGRPRLSLTDTPTLHGNCTMAVRGSPPGPSRSIFRKPTRLAGRYFFGAEPMHSARSLLYLADRRQKGVDREQKAEFLRRRYSDY